MTKYLLAAVSVVAVTGVAAAQDLPDSLVTVNIQDVLQDVAIELNVSENSIPVNIQLPVSVAANVCDVDVGVLTAQLDAGSASCVAVTGSQQITQIVSQQITNTGTTESAADGSSAGEGEIIKDDTTTGSTTD